MDSSIAITQQLLPYFFDRLERMEIKVANPQGIINCATSIYLTPGQRIEQPEPCMFFLAHGLLKEYYRTSRAIQPAALVQLLMPDDLWIYNQHIHGFRTRALAPSWLIQIPIDQLHCIVDTRERLIFWLEELDLRYGAKQCLSDFLKAQPDKYDRIHIFLEEYGPYVDYISDNEIQAYVGIYSSFVRRIRDLAVLYQRFEL